MKLISGLMEILEKNAELYEQIAKKTREERESLEKGTLESLNEIIKEKEAIAHKIKNLEVKRGKLMVMIGGELDKSPKDISLRELAQLPENSSISKKLMALRQRLNVAVNLTKELGDFNRDLIGKAVNSIKESFLYVNNLLDRPATYSKGRMIQNPIPAGRMITRAY